MKSEFIPKVIFEKKGRYNHRAAWVVCNPYMIIENGIVETCDGIITRISSGKGLERPEDRSVSLIDHGKGVLMPGLVNAHVHFELCALKGLVSYENNFRSWVRELIEKRAQLSETVLLKEAEKQIGKVHDSGTCLVGEISTLGITDDILVNSSLDGIWFQEYLGPRQKGIKIKNSRKQNFLHSLAGHAPHTCAPDLLKMLKEKSLNKGLPFSIHLAESEDETEFISSKKGEWANFLTSRKIDYSSWPLLCKSPVIYLDKLGLLDQLTMAVHLLNVDENDLEIIAQSKTKVCICPRSNKNLHSKLPDIHTMFEKGIKPALGTDSLASCSSLNIFDEMAFIFKNYPGISPQIIFEMATLNGAKALGFENFAGSLEPGKKAQFIYLDISVNNQNELLESIVSNEQ